MQTAALVLLISAMVQVRPSYSEDIRDAYVHNRMDKWKAIMESMQNEKNITNARVLELVSYQYGFIGYCITFNNKDEAEKYLVLAEKNVEFLEKQKFMLSDVYSYMSALYGFRMKINPITIPFNGLKSIRYARLALELDSTNYLAQIQNGYVYSNMPASIGGSAGKGLTFYLKARELLEADRRLTEGNWLYLNMLVVIAQTYTSLDDFFTARSIYESILRLEPEFEYVKNTLYPELLKKMQQ